MVQFYIRVSKVEIYCVIDCVPVPVHDILQWTCCNVSVIVPLSPSQCETAASV